jgi:hypothetical protein
MGNAFSIPNLGFVLVFGGGVARMRVITLIARRNLWKSFTKKALTKF